MILNWVANYGNAETQTSNLRLGIIFGDIAISIEEKHQ